MQKIFIIFLFFTTFLQAKTLLINQNDIIHFDNFTLAYFIDETANKKFSEIQKEEFIYSKNKNSLGKVNATWFKFKIKNNTDKKIDFFLNDSLAYVNLSIEVYELSKGKLLKKFIFDYDKNINNTPIKNTGLIYPITLQAKQTKTIYLKHESPTFQFFNFLISDLSHIVKELSYKHVFDIFILGMLCSLALYNFILFISSKYEEYFYYTLFLLSSIVWVYASSGAMIFLGIQGTSAFNFLGAIFFLPIFTSLFLKSILKTGSIENKFLLSVIIIFLINICIAFFDIFLALQITSGTFTYAIIVFAGVAYSQHKKGNSFAKIFIFAHLSYTLSVIISNLFFLGYLPLNTFTFNIDSAGIAIEAVILAYLISCRIKILQDEAKSKDKEIVIQSNIANRDFLTNAYNRRFFFDSSTGILSRAKRGNYNLAIATLDIDHFKQVNDTYGHDAGDIAIKEVVNILEKHLRTYDLFARFGGEEFCIILENLSEKEVSNVFEKIRIAFEENIIYYKEVSINYTVSIGVCYGYSNSISKMVTSSDEALYTAKRSGRNQVQFLLI